MCLCRQILVVLALLVRVLHWAPALCGLSATIAMIPAGMITGRKLASIRRRLMARTDSRIKLCSEVVTGMHTSPFPFHSVYQSWCDVSGLLLPVELTQHSAQFRVRN